MFRLNTTILFENKTYTKEIKSLIGEQLPLWLRKNHAYPVEIALRKVNAMKKKSTPEKVFGRHYTDNFQLR